MNAKFPAPSHTWPPGLVVATHNAGKLREWMQLLRGTEVQTPGMLQLPEPEETEPTYLGNAELKARAAAQRTGLPALADDTGFEVARLGGIPGVHTARYAEQAGGWASARRAIYTRALDAHATDVERARNCAPHARLVCAVAWAHGDEVRSVQAEIAGVLRWPPTTAPGFAALLETEEALLEHGVLAHRRRAFAALTQLLARQPASSNR